MKDLNKDEEFERLAVLKRQLSKTEFLAELDKLADWDCRQLSELLVFLAHEGGDTWPTKLCLLGADVNFATDSGETALSQCVHGAMTEFGQPGNNTLVTAIELLTLGADANLKYHNTYSVASLAATWNRAEFVALFLLAGVDPTTVIDDGQSLRAFMLEHDQEWPKQLLRLRDAYSERNRT